MRQRHQEAACNYCFNACPSGALQFTNREVHLSEDRCLGCGVCLIACPVECFVTDEWSERSLLPTLQRLKRDGVEIACRLHPKPQEGTEAVPVIQQGACLGAISPGLWFEIGQQYNVKLRLDACEDCPITRLSLYARHAVKLANSWLLSCGHPARVEIQDCLRPNSTVIQRRIISAERPILNRRDFLFAFARSSGVPDQAFSCLPAEPSDSTTTLKNPPHYPTWLRRMVEVYPGYPVKEAAAAEDTAERSSEYHTNSVNSINCAMWPTLSVTENCTACGACARYCPSGSLSTRVIEGKFIHFFTPGVCVACGLCAQVCRPGAMTRGYAPEPNPFEESVMAERNIKSCRKCGSPAIRESKGLCYWCAEEPSLNSLMENARSVMLER